MLADFFTKPLQGALFNKFRDVIMGYKPISSLTPFPDEERVGINEQMNKSIKIIRKIYIRVRPKIGIVADVSKRNNTSSEYNQE